MPIPPDLYDAPGPFATVYLDASRSTESGATEVELRWRDTRVELERDGAGGADLDALEAAVQQDRSTPGRHGLALVATGGNAVFVADLPRPPARPGGRWAPLPHLMPYLAATTQQVRHVLVVADRAGADIGLERSGIVVSQESVGGQQAYPLHRTATSDWSEWHFQNRVENTWRANARDVAAEVAKHVASTGARLVVLAGDPRARSLIREALSGEVPPSVVIEDVEAGGRAEGASEQALADAARDAVLRQVWRERRELLEHLQQNLGRHEYATAGVANVVDALRQGQADTVVVSDDPTSTLEAWIGRQSIEFGLNADELSAMGVSDPARDRFDAALVRAAVGTGARLVLTPNAHDYLPEGIGALLRYETNRDQ
jgi:hypothetical protein